MALKLGPSTRDLHLEDDLITDFPSSAFVGLTKLDWLNFGRNLLTKPPKNILSVHSLIEKAPIKQQQDSLHQKRFTAIWSNNRIEFIR